MALSLSMQKRSSVAMQVGTCSRSLTKPFSPLVPCRPPIWDLDLYRLCCEERQGRMRKMLTHRSHNEIKLRMRLLCHFSTKLWHNGNRSLKRKNSSLRFSYIHPSLVFSVFGGYFVITYLYFQVCPLVSSASISFIDFRHLPTRSSVSRTCEGGKEVSSPAAHPCLGLQEL